ncbi:MAG: hypothetical protein DRG78_10615 [Epsilonproteobacteria bacterium]|nr:MAG: hypothetical protein DRG78_10615 [Campylobacterota bacterium]
MEFDTSTLMMIFFIIALVISIWKIYAFLPNKELPDDDTTEESKIDLTNIMLTTIKNSDGNLSVDELFVKIEESEDFDSQKYWRFNKNRLNQLLNAYYIEHPHTESIEDIYKNI